MANWTLEAGRHAGDTRKTRGRHAEGTRKARGRHAEDTRKTENQLKLIREYIKEQTTTNDKKN